MTTPADALELALRCCWLEASAPLAIGHQGRLQALLPNPQGAIPFDGVQSYVRWCAHQFFFWVILNFILTMVSELS
jgi:hypothetical protein